MIFVVYLIILFLLFKVVSLYLYPFSSRFLVTHVLFKYCLLNVFFVFSLCVSSQMFYLYICSCSMYCLVYVFINFNGAA